jgi:eukaryotic-like serine/threonine-protein kinase
MPVEPVENTLLQTVHWPTEELRNFRSQVSLEAERDSLKDLIGTDLGRYHVESLLGRGGMGWVFLVRHLELHRACALKILSPVFAREDPDYLDRFFSEGRAAAALVHPNIVTVHAIGEHEGLNFLEMEFVPGRSLQTSLREGPLPLMRALSLALGMAQGLSAAHRSGIIHRDLKPDNVLLAHNGTPKISDFGLAKRLHGDLVEELPGTIAGTPHYMAPELFSGEPASPGSDVYALGVTLFAMLTGQLPFPRRGLNAMISAVTRDPPPNIRDLRPDIPLEIAECISMMMEKTPANRPRDGIEAAQLIQAVLGQARDIETLLHEAFDHEPHVEWKRDNLRYLCLVTLPDGRMQTVFIETTGNEFHERLLQIFSLCCPAEDHYYVDALRLNASIFHGALALREVDGKEFFVMVNNYPRATVDSEEIRSSVLELAMHADAVEHHLTGEDKH